MAGALALLFTDQLQSLKTQWSSKKEGGAQYSQPDLSQTAAYGIGPETVRIPELVSYRGKLGPDCGTLGFPYSKDASPELRRSQRQRESNIQNEVEPETQKERHRDRKRAIDRMKQRQKDTETQREQQMKEVQKERKGEKEKDVSM